MTLEIGVLVVVFILAVWWLAWHPDWGLPRWPEIERDPPKRYGHGDPGPIRTEIERR